MTIRADIGDRGNSSPGDLKKEEIMIGETFCTGGVINLENGEYIKDLNLEGLPQNRRFIIEFVGINAFAQPGQKIFVALQVHTNSRKGIYPIAPIGNSPFSDPNYPARIFGSQQVQLYADPNSDLIITVARDNDNAGARAFIDLSGRLIKSSRAESLSPPHHIRMS